MKISITVKEAAFFNLRVENNLAQFKQEADLSVINQILNEVLDVAYKVYGRDLFGKD